MLRRIRNRDNVYGVLATDSSNEPATVATPTLRLDVIDARLIALGASTDLAKAELLGVDRVTLWRWRNEKQVVSLPVAIRVAERLGLPITEILTSTEASR